MEPSRDSSLKCHLAGRGLFTSGTRVSLGDFRCPRPEGRDGDGRVHGTGCVPCGIEAAQPRPTSQPQLPALRLPWRPFRGVTSQPCCSKLHFRKTRAFLVPLLSPQGPETLPSRVLPPWPHSLAFGVTSPTRPSSSPSHTGVTEGPPKEPTDPAFLFYPLSRC